MKKTEFDSKVFVSSLCPGHPDHQAAEVRGVQRLPAALLRAAVHPLHPLLPCRGELRDPRARLGLLLRLRQHNRLHRDRLVFLNSNILRLSESQYNIASASMAFSL